MNKQKTLRRKRSKPKSSNQTTKKKRRTLKNKIIRNTIIRNKTRKLIQKGGGSISEFLERLWNAILRLFGMGRDKSRNADTSAEASDKKVMADVVRKFIDSMEPPPPPPPRLDPSNIIDREQVRQRQLRSAETMHRRNQTAKDSKDSS